MGEIGRGGAHHSPLKKKRISVKKVLIALGVVVVLIAAFFAIKLLTREGTVSSRTIEYTFKLENGTVLAENVSSFKPGKFASSFGLISDSIDDAINKLKKGQSTEVTLNAEDAFGEYNESLVSVVNRTIQIKRFYELNKTIEMPVDYFKSIMQEDPEIGKEYEVGEPWNISITKIDGDNVTLSRDAKLGFAPFNEIIYINVTKINESTIELLYGAEDQTISIPQGNLTITSDQENIYQKITPEIGQILTIGDKMGRVTDFNETNIVLDANAPYAGEKIIVEAKVIDVVKKAAAKSSSSLAKVEGAPTLEVFVMSFCPYGTQMEKGVIPAMKLLNGKANFEIRFVSYTMHGDKEVQENNRQVCLREEQPEKFWDYLECFLDAGDAAGCVSSVGADESKLSECMSSRAADYLAVDNDLNTQYGVQGSPTTVLDGEVTEIYPRSPEDVKTAVCAVFDNPPAECDEVLDSENPSPGFGYSTSSSSGSAGGCGTA